MNRKTIKTFAILWSLLGLTAVSVHFAPGTKIVEQPTVAQPTAAPRPQQPVATAPTSAPVDTAAIAKDPRVQQINSEPALAKYFDELELTAKKNGAVTDELARANEAAKRLKASPALARRMFDFADRMRLLSFELKWGPLQKELASLRDKIGSERDAAARQKLVAEYNGKSARLPAAGRLAASEQLKRVLQS